MKARTAVVVPAVVEVREIPLVAVSPVQADLPLGEHSSGHVELRVLLVSDTTSFSEHRIKLTRDMI